RIEDQGLENAFKTYYFLLKNGNNPDAENMSAPLIKADEHIYFDIHELLSLTILQGITLEKIEEIISILIFGMFDEYIYSNYSFNDFLERVKVNLNFVISPYIKGFKTN